MRIRRCLTVLLERRENVSFELDELLRGGDGLRRTLHWVAWAPHLLQEVMLSRQELDVLEGISPSCWTDVDSSSTSMSGLQRLLDIGLVLVEGDLSGHARADNDQRSVPWHPLAAVFHAFTRWKQVDCVDGMHRSGTDTLAGMRAVLGPPPPVMPEGMAIASELELQRPDFAAFDRLLSQRTTCRNFDHAVELSQQAFASVMHRVFAAHGVYELDPDTKFLKKNVPSGGGLHPIEAYLLIQKVSGVDAGLYHYDPCAHSIRRLTNQPVELSRFAAEALAQQHWFTSAHVITMLVARFDRAFWKYRRHAKAYRALAVEVGHLSQMLYLAATDAGLGAFVTAAINEESIERVLSLDPMRNGVVALCGFGVRSARMETAELDPMHIVWTNDGARRRD